MNYDKLPLSYSQLIEKLASRDMSIPNPEKAKQFLQFVSYYRFSGYAQAFEVKQEPSEKRSHAFTKGTSFEDVVSLYVVDSAVRSLLLQAIEQIEVAIRSVINHEMACKYNDSHWYLDPSLFKESDYFSHSKLLEMIEKEVDPAVNNKKKKKREAFISHYLNNYKTPTLPPCWMLAEILTLGNWSNIYTNLENSTDKKMISRCFNLPPQELQSWLHALTYLRNLCAHHARLCNRNFVITPSLKLFKANFKHNQLYSYIICIDTLVKVINQQEDWVKKVREVMLQLPQSCQALYGSAI